jgi:S-adenosylmethionine hydrolase
MPRPVVTLTTDFGLSDHYVGTMKGVILRICPNAQVVDISHDVMAYGVAEGAYVIAQAYRYFPKRTVHVVVVDPGVGSQRRAIVAEAGGQYFVAPDNGVLGMIYAREKHKVRVLANERYFVKPVSRTFHGRDIFSPVGAHLAAGVKASRLGKRVDDYVQPDFARPAQTKPGTWSGHILKIDRFGNIVTNFRASDLPKPAAGSISLTIGSHAVTSVAANYADSAPGEPFVISGSGGYLEVSINQSSAARRIGCQAGDRVELTTAPTRRRKTHS